MRNNSDKEVMWQNMLENIKYVEKVRETLQKRWGIYNIYIY